MSNQSALLDLPNYVEATIDWTDKALAYLIHSRHLNSFESQRIRTILFEHKIHLLKTKEFISKTPMRTHVAEIELNELVFQHIQFNRKAWLYEIKPYEPDERLQASKPQHFELSVTGEGMHPFMRVGDTLVCDPLNASGYLSFRGVGILIYRSDKTQPRHWVTGRIEPVANRLIRVSHDNKAQGHLDRVVPLWKVVFLLQVNQIIRTPKP